MDRGPANRFRPDTIRPTAARGAAILEHQERLAVRQEIKTARRAAGRLQGHARAYGSFWALGQDEGSSRIWGGIHYCFEIDASEQSCAQVANYIYGKYMRGDRN